MIVAKFDVAPVRRADVAHPRIVIHDELLEDQRVGVGVDRWSLCVDDAL